MNQQTALQILREWIEENSFDTENQAGRRFIAVDSEDLQTKLLSLLPIERSDIEDAFHHGKNDSFEMFEDQYSDYFAQTYLSETGEVEQSDLKTVNEVMTFSDEDFVKSVYPDAIIMSDYNPMYGDGFAIRSKLECIGWNRYSRGFAWADAAQRIRTKSK